MKPKLTIDLQTEWGNLFWIVGKASRTLREAGQVDEADELELQFIEIFRKSTGHKRTNEVNRLIEDYCQVSWLNG